MIIPPLAAINRAILFPEEHLPSFSITTDCIQAVREIAVPLLVVYSSILSVALLEVFNTNTAPGVGASVLALFECDVLKLLHVVSGDTLFGLGIVMAISILILPIIGNVKVLQALDWFWLVFFLLLLDKMLP